MKTIFKGVLVAIMVFVASTAFAQSTQDVKYQGEINVSYGIPAMESVNGVINVETIHGIRVNPNIALGLGLGLNVFKSKDDDNSKKKLLMPLFVDVKWYVLSGKISPYLAADVGYNFGLNKGDKGESDGMYFAVGAGVSFKMKEKGAFNLGLALRNNGVYAKAGAIGNIISLDIKAAIVF